MYYLCIVSFEDNQIYQLGEEYTTALDLLEDTALTWLARFPEDIVMLVGK